MQLMNSATESLESLLGMKMLDELHVELMAESGDLSATDPRYIPPPGHLRMKHVCCPVARDRCSIDNLQASITPRAEHHNVLLE